MSEKSLSILFIADIVGKPGLDITTALLPNLKKEYHIDLCIANGENADKGNGLTETLARQFFSIGIDIITGGNHTWSNFAFRHYLDTSKRVLRPLNYPDAPGTGSTVHMVRDNIPVGIINLQGRTFLYPIDCPFKTGHEEIIRLRERTKIIFVDFHAEATAEKMAFAWYIDGKVSAVVGTHTHVQTADERLLPLGTAYITDAGMTGPFDSVIGMDAQVAIKRFMTMLPEKYRIATSNIRFCGVVVEIDIASGKANKIIRLNLP
ncbi:TIGR00282 family metallophosphoesterase [candidate division KSB1 bacterium]|nr:TIGR00282 family metallophosphoesterase [candidate division KSB1 bacterium]